MPNHRKKKVTIALNDVKTNSHIASLQTQDLRTRSSRLFAKCGLLFQAILTSDIRVLLFYLSWLFILTLFLVVVFCIDYPKTPIIALFDNLINQWDSGWYHGIVTYGYQWNGNTSLQQNVAFFPLYPLLVVILKKIILVNQTVAEMLVSVTFGALSAIYTYKLYSLCIKDLVEAKKFTVLAIMFPMSIYSLTGYPTSLLLFLIVFCIYTYLKEKRCAAFIIAGLAAGAGPVALSLPIGIAIYEAIQKGWKYVTSIKNIAIYLLGMWGFFAYMVYLYIRFRSPLAMIMVQNAWHGHQNIGTLIARAISLSPIKNSLICFLNHPSQPNFMYTQDGFFIVFIALIIGTLFIDNDFGVEAPILLTGFFMLYVFQVSEYNNAPSFIRLISPLVALLPLSKTIRSKSDQYYIPLLVIFAFFSFAWIFFLSHGLWVE